MLLHYLVVIVVVSDWRQSHVINCRCNICCKL